MIFSRIERFQHLRRDSKYVRFFELRLLMEPDSKAGRQLTFVVHRKFRPEHQRFLDTIYYRRTLK